MGRAPWHAAASWLPEPADLLRTAREAATRPPDEAEVALLQGLGAPFLDLVAAPFERRASLLAAGRGGAFLHHEQLVRLPVPEALAPEVAVWDGDTVPEWRAGVLEEPKYFGFRQDVRLPAFNPNHRRRWRPHELLHTVVGFLWRPDLTRFEAYLGARLNELLPVAHWYGTAEIHRRRCPEHAEGPLRTELCGACEALACPAWLASPEELALLEPRAEAFAAHLLEHLGSELTAIHEEQRTGRRVSTPRPGLDASSDAVGYLRGHWNRLVGWSMGAWVEGFCVAGVDHETSVEALGERVATTARELLSGELEIDAARAGALRARRLLQELGYRAMICLDWLEPGSRAHREQAAAWAPALDLARTRCAELLAGEAEAEAGLEAATLLARALDAAPLPEHLRGLPGAVGARWWRGPGPAEVAQVVDGLDSALPSGVAEVSGLEALAAAFLAAPEAELAGDLGLRFATWLLAAEAPAGALAPPASDPRLALSPELRADLAFEGWLRALPRQDLEADRFAEDLEELDSDVLLGELLPAWLRLHRTVRVRAWPAEHAARWLALDDGSAPELPLRGAPEAPEVLLAAAWQEDLPQVLALDEVTAAVLGAVDQGLPLAREGPAAMDALRLLLTHGLVVLVRPPR